MDQAKQTASNIGEKARETAASVADKAKQAASTVKEKADQAVSGTGSGMQSLAGQIRERGPQEGMLGSASSAVAGTLEQSGRYLEEHGLSGVADDLTNTIRRNPIPAVLISIGIGYLLAKMTTPRNT
jgi:ElaB/YqjD/DUF883 family membrane-anchored ribosome-binding protein